MSENTHVEEPGPYDIFLTERLAAFREENPSYPVPYLRMRLQKELVEDLQARPKDAKSIVDNYLGRHGMAMRQPTLWECILTGIVGAIVLLLLVSPLYFFLKFLRPR